MFHVKHCAASENDSIWDVSLIHTPVENAATHTARSIQQKLTKPHSYPQCLFSDAEVPENNVENVVNVDAAGEAAQGACSKPQFLGKKIFAV